MSLERGYCSHAKLQVLSRYWGWKEACQALRTISTPWRRELSSSFIFLLFFPFFFFSRQGTQGNSSHSERNIRGTCTIVYHRQNRMAQFKFGDFSTCDAPHPRRPETVTTLEIIDQIHELIFEDHRISAKSLVEQLDIPRERVGPIIHEHLDMRKLAAKWVLKCLNLDQKCQQCRSSEQLLEFFRHNPKWFPVAIGDHGWNLVTSLWPGDKATINGVAA